MVNGKQKGKRGELEVAELIRKYGFAARRGQQFKGGPDSPDVIHDMDGFHVEVKRTETISPYVALGQAESDAGRGEVPVVFHRKNNRGWLVLLKADDFLSLVAQAKAGGVFDDL